MKLLILSALLVSCAISKTKLSDDGREVKVLTQKNNPECDVLDKVTGVNEKGLDSLAKNHARNLAARLDGNAIYFNEVISNGDMVKAHGTVFLCQ